jgi:hypothetical protein
MNVRFVAIISILPVTEVGRQSPYLLGRPMEAADIPGFARRLRSMANAATPDDRVTHAPQVGPLGAKLQFGAI